MQAQNFLSSQDFLHAITIGWPYPIAASSQEGCQMKPKMRQSHLSGTMPPKSSGKPSTQNPLTQLVLAVCTTTLQEGLSLDIVTAWVQFLESWYSFSWWRELLWYGKNHIACIVCTHTPHFTPLSVCYQSHRILLPDSSWSLLVKLSRALWEEDDVGVGGRLFTVTWLVTSLEKKTFFAFHPSLATPRQQHMLPRVFHSVFHWYSSLHF